MTEPSLPGPIPWPAWNVRGFSLVAAHEKALTDAARSAEGEGDWKRVEETGYALREFLRSTAIKMSTRDRA